MLRRRYESSFLLISQAEHARVAAELVPHLGRGLAMPADPSAVATAVRLQAAGFAELDATPPLNPTGRPAHFNELSLVRQLHAWAAGAAAAEAADPYAGLLVSILSLQRSAAAAKGQLTLRELFEANKHQQREIERQQRLRTQVGLSNDIPMRNGLPESHAALTEAQHQLLFDCRLLLLLQAIALELCMRQRIFGDFPPVPFRPAAASGTIHFRWHDGSRMSLDPYPFAQELIAVTITGRAVPAKAYDHELELHEVLAAAAPVQLRIRLTPGD